MLRGLTTMLTSIYPYKRRPAIMYQMSTVLCSELELQTDQCKRHKMRED